MLQLELSPALPHSMRLQPFLEQPHKGNARFGAFLARKAIGNGNGSAFDQHANHRIGIDVLIQSGTDRSTERLQSTVAVVAIVEPIHPGSIRRAVGAAKPGTAADIPVIIRHAGRKSPKAHAGLPAAAQHLAHPPP